MPKNTPPSLVKRCSCCGEAKPLHRFARHLTARQVISNYERRRAAGTLSDDPDVLEFTAEDRAWAAAQYPPMTLTKYKLVQKTRIESRICLDCRPQAPFEGSLKLPVDVLDAIYSGALAPTVERSRVLVDAKLAPRRKEALARAYKKRSFVAVRRRVVNRIRTLVALELRATRNKIYYLERQPVQRRRNPDGEAQMRLLRAYLGLVQAIHRLIKDTTRLPACVWQIVLRGGDISQFVAQHIPPIVAMACGDKAYEDCDEVYAVDEALLLAQRASDDYVALMPSYPTKLRWLALAEHQGDAIEAIHYTLEQTLAAYSMADNDWAEILSGAPSGRKGVPQLNVLMAQEDARFKRFRKRAAEPLRRQVYQEACPPTPQVSPEAEARLGPLLDGSVDFDN